MNKIVRKYRINIFLSLSAIIFFFLTTILVDRWCIHLTNEPIIYTPNSKAFYHTCEFDFTAQINALGIRDYEVKEKEEKEIRILAIGDSYTYGWGVGIDSTWVKLSESILKEKGFKIKIFNAGQGGTFSKDYAEIAQKAIPIIKPDIVLICFLQANDLWSAANYQKNIIIYKKENQHSFKIFANYILQKLYPNTFSQIKYRKNYFSIQENWKDESKQLLHSFNEKELLKYNSLDLEIKQNFENGLLSPSVIFSTIKTPQCYSALEDSSSAFVKNGVKQIVNDLASIKEYSAKYNCKLALLFIPDRVYVSKKDNAILKYQLLIDVDSNFTSSLIVNNQYKNIAHHINLPFLDCNNAFSEQSDSVMLYYPFDGHLTYKGNSLLSKQVSAWLEHNYLKDE